MLLFDFNNIRYVTSTHIGEWARDKMTRYALLTRGGDPHIWDFGSAAKHHRLNCPWLRPENVHAGMVGLRGAVAPDAGLFRAAAREIRDILRAEGAADMPLGVDIGEPPMLAALEAEGLTVRDGQQVMLDAREVKSIDEIILLNTACAMVDGAYQYISENLKPGVRESVLVADVTKFLFDLGSEHVDNINAVSGERCSPHPHVFSDRIIRPGDQAFFDIIHTFIGYKTCYYRTFVVGIGSDAQRDAYKQAREWIDASIELMRPGVTTDQVAAVWPKARGVRLRQRDGVLRAPVRPQRRPVPPRAADHQPAQLARPPGRAQGGDGHRARDVLSGEGRRVRRPDRGGGRDHRRGAARDHPLPVATSCSWRTRTEAGQGRWRSRRSRSSARPDGLGDGRAPGGAGRAARALQPDPATARPRWPSGSAATVGGHARPRPPPTPTSSSRWSPTTPRSRRSTEARMASSAGLRPGPVAVDMSTVLPDTIRALAAAVRARGAGVLDAPVSGSVTPGPTGELTIMVGGDAADLERARPVLERLARRVFHLGPLGTGAAMKLAVNTVIFGLNEAVAEALVLAERNGIERALAYEVLAASAAGAPMVGLQARGVRRPDAARRSRSRSSSRPRTSA